MIATELDRDALLWVWRLRILTIPQLAQIQGRSEKGAQETLLRLVKAGYLETVPLPVNHKNVYRLTRTGARVIQVPTPKRFQLDSRYRIDHEVSVRDILAWLAASCRSHGLPPPEACVSSLRTAYVTPDALCVLTVGKNILACIVESDRATEDARRWKPKAEGYRSLIESGGIKELTGYQYARIVVVTRTLPDLARILGYLKEAAPEHLDWFWLTEESSLHTPSFTAPVWLRADSETRRPLLAESQITASDGPSDGAGAVRG